MIPKETEVLIIGAAPAGTAAASMLLDNGIQPVIIEKSRFPRFMIGESLLPQATQCLEQAGLFDAVKVAGYQHKDGACFANNHGHREFCFKNKYSAGHDYSWEVPRADFDKRLADECQRKGAQIFYETTLVDAKPHSEGYEVVVDIGGKLKKIKAGFIVDASGFGRCLARLFGLDRASGLPPRCAVFTHIQDTCMSENFDRNKILIAQAEVGDKFWYWLIPFSNNTLSIGVVFDSNSFDGNEFDINFMEKYVSRCKPLTQLLKRIIPVRTVDSLSAYSSNISQLHGRRYVILGNAGEFIDPIFSSGVTIALKSSVMAVPLIVRELRGEHIDWKREFEDPLRAGVQTFKNYVEAWYSGVLPRLFFGNLPDQKIANMICSILAGYVWDRTNPFTKATPGTLEKLEYLANE